MILKKPIQDLPIVLLVLILFLTFQCKTAYANNVPLVIIGRIVEKQDSTLVIQQNKNTLVPVNIDNIATLAVLDSRRASHGVAGAIAIGAGAGMFTVLIAGNGPRNIREISKGTGTGALLGPLKFVWNKLTDQPPEIIYHVKNGPGVDGSEIIKNLPLGTRVRVTHKNNL